MTETKFSIGDEVSINLKGTTSLGVISAVDTKHSRGNFYVIKVPREGDLKPIIAVRHESQI